MGWLPSRAAVVGAAAAVFWAIIAFFSGKAKRDTERAFRLKDHEHADDIAERVSDGRADFDDGVRPHRDDGWRD